MRSLFAILIMGLSCAGALATEAAPSSIYDPNPEHLWNRLYRAVAMRAQDGTQYGADNSEPYSDPFDDPASLTAVLDEFLSDNGKTSLPGNLHRALLLNDVWAAFDLEVAHEGRPLAQKLARVIGRLRMPAAAIAALPDNYAQAVKSRLRRISIPSIPRSRFCPLTFSMRTAPGCRSASTASGPVAPMHVQQLSGRSAFLVFLRVPGGRKATLAYLQTLNLYRTPWEFRPAELATNESTGEFVRWDPLRFNRETPQFAAGTTVALVRQMIVINDKLEPVPTPITQSVQFRVYRKVSGNRAELTFANFGTWQSVYEFVMRRRDLLAGRAGGLHAIKPGEREYRLASVPMRVGREEQLIGPAVLSTCARCHHADGIFSINSYTRTLTRGGTTNPQLLPAISPEYQRAETVYWKRQQFDWGMLRGLIEAHEQVSASER